MSSIESAALGLVQGLTEFLPISSSAHLVLVPYFLRWEDPGLAYDVALHLGSLLAILLFFWKDWLEIVKDFIADVTRKPPCKPQSGVTWKLLVLSTIPGVVAGLGLEKQAEATFRNPILIAVTLALFGLLLFYWDTRGKRNRGLDAVKVKDALLVGCAQALAIIPGVSRSGITITTALWLGFTRPSAVRFSFLLSAPIIGGAGLHKIKYIVQAIKVGGGAARMVGLGFAASLVSSLLAIGLLTTIVRSKSFTGFVVYRIGLATVIVLTAVLN